LAVGLVLMSACVCAADSELIRGDSHIHIDKVEERMVSLSNGEDYISTQTTGLNVWVST
jgi:hypothetical protein